MINSKRALVYGIIAISLVVMAVTISTLIRFNNNNSLSIKSGIQHIANSNNASIEQFKNQFCGLNSKDVDNDITKVDPKLAPLQYFLGILGITGITAYVGLLKIGELRDGLDTVFVSSAAGGVGSVACQIAKIKDCHVVGSCGSDEKVKFR